MKLLAPLVFACVLAPSAAGADAKRDAKAHLAAAAKAHEEGRYGDVLVELEQAYALDPRPALHYSIGQTYVKLDRCEDAIGAYERFLASRPRADQADLANQAIATCRERLAKQAATSPEALTRSDDDAPPDLPVAAVPASATLPGDASAAAGGTATPGAPATLGHADAPRAWYKDTLGLGLAAGGTAATIVGLVLYSGARGKIDDAEAAGTYAESHELYADARGQRTLSVIFIAGGVAAIGVGGWRLWQRRSAERDHLTVAPTSGGGTITWSGRF